MASEQILDETTTSSTLEPKLHLNEIKLGEPNDTYDKEFSEPEIDEKKLNQELREIKNEETLKKFPKIDKDSLGSGNKPKNKWGVILLVFALLFSIVSLSVYFTRNNKTDTTTATTSSSTTNSGDFTLIKEFGEVLYKENGDYQNLAEDEKELKNGSFVKVVNGSAHVLFANNSLLSIDSNSEVEIKSENGNIDINQLAGNTWNRVKKLTSNESYTVTTPTALATVRGTVFGVEVGNLISGFYTIEGKVDVSQFDLNKNPGTPNEITSPEFVEIKPFGTTDSIITGNLLPEENQGRWFVRNRDIDKIFDANGKFNVEKFLQNIRQNPNLIKILKENKSNTKKEGCLELLDQSEIIKKEVGFINIATPADNSEFKTTDTIKFETQGINPCTRKAFDDNEIKWYLDDKVVEYATGKVSEQKNLPVGEYTVTVKVLIDSKELTDNVKFKVVAPASSSSSSKKSSSSSKITNKPPVIVINSPTAGTIFDYDYSQNFPTVSVDVNLIVTVTDPEDGVLIGSKITWKMDSNKGNSFGDGNNFLGQCFGYAPSPTPSVVYTNCTITVKATDSQGLSATNSVVVKVSSNQAMGN